VRHGLEPSSKLSRMLLTKLYRRPPEPMEVPKDQRFTLPTISIKTPPPISGAVAKSVEVDLAPRVLV